MKIHYLKYFGMLPSSVNIYIIYIYVNNKDLSFNKYGALSFILFVYSYALRFYSFIYIYIYIYIYICMYAVMKQTVNSFVD